MTHIIPTSLRESPMASELKQRVASALFLGLLVTATFNCSSALAFSNKQQPTFSRTTSIMASKSGDVAIIGVCGGIGSGKSTACQLLVNELGCLAHIDSDTIAHGIYRPNSPALKDVVEEFGTDILTDTGELDRPKLGAIVFSDLTAMQKLERIVWPHVNDEIQARIADIKKKETTEGKTPVIIVEAAVMLDAGWQDDFLDEVWVVTVPEHVALQRLQEKRGLSAEEARKRIDAQKTRRGLGNLEQEVENGVVKAVISNDQSLEHLQNTLASELDRVSTR